MQVKPDAFHTHEQIREQAQRMLTLTRERRKLEDELDTCQQKLAVLFDLLQVETFSIDIGTLQREHKKEGGFGWKIEVE